MAEWLQKWQRSRKAQDELHSHVDCGDNVIVLNADQVVLSGNKEEAKEYMHYTGYPGGQRIKSVAQVRDSKPTFMVEAAVRGMLPKTKLGRAIWKSMHDG